MSTTITDSPEILDAPATFAVMQEVVNERIRQDAKWGGQNHPDGTGPLTQPLVDFTSDASTASILAALATENTDEQAAAGSVTFADILLGEVFEALAESDPVKLRMELVQVSAVAAQWAEALDRREQRARELGVFA